MPITKGLIIDDPWISKILRGEKVWEMRATNTAFRGTFALIRKGSGQVVGVATLHGVSGPHDRASLANTENRHCVGSAIYSRPDYKWWYAWELRDVKQLQQPVRYVHKNGAVIWVDLDPAAIRDIQDALSKAPLVKQSVSGNTVNTEEVATAITNTNQDIRTTSPDAGSELRIILTQGNINNAHFYIPRQTTLFPESVWGGKNKSEAGTEVEFRLRGLSYPVFSDIDGSKRIIRNRSAINEFYRLHSAAAGDEIRIKKETDGKFTVYLAR